MNHSICSKTSQFARVRPRVAPIAPSARAVAWAQRQCLLRAWTVVAHLSCGAMFGGMGAIEGLVFRRVRQLPLGDHSQIWKKL